MTFLAPQLYSHLKRTNLLDFRNQIRHLCLHLSHYMPPSQSLTVYYSKLKFTCRAHHAGCRSAHSHMQQQLVRARQRTPCDPAVEDEELGEEGRLRTPEARTRAVRSDGASSARAEGSSNPCGMAVNLAAHAKMQEPSVKEKRAWRRPRS